MNETKKWYQSKTVWGGIISGMALAATAVTGFLGNDITPVLQTIVAIAGLFGVPVVIYGRVKATKALK